jgi:hypothetical protein
MMQSCVSLFSRVNVPHGQAAILPCPTTFGTTSKAAGPINQQDGGPVTQHRKNWHRLGRPLYLGMFCNIDFMPSWLSKLTPIGCRWLQREQDVYQSIRIIERDDVNLQSR